MGVECPYCCYTTGAKWCGSLVFKSCYWHLNRSDSSTLSQRVFSSFLYSYASWFNDFCQCSGVGMLEENKRKKSKWYFNSFCCIDLMGERFSVRKLKYRSEILYSTLGNKILRILVGDLMKKRYDSFWWKSFIWFQWKFIQIIRYFHKCHQTVMIHSEEHFDMYQIQRGDSDKEESKWIWLAC